jgi:glycerophosphoryl diester phosphodiesterase
MGYSIGKKRIITHRGLEPLNPNLIYGESTYEAFQNHLSRGFGGIEFDPNPTKDGIIVLHDSTLERATGGYNKQLVSEITTKEAIRAKLIKKGRIATFQEILDLIKTNKATMNAIHLKYRLQTPQMLDCIIEALAPYKDSFNKFIVFDIKPDTARLLKKTFKTLRLAPSVAHPYDIVRYNEAVGGTLLTLEEALELKKEGLVDGIWGDEWDRTGENGTSKIFYTPELFEKIHAAGMFVAIVTPELHGTSPGLYGGESHADARDTKTLFTRIKQIKDAGADYFCTDYPEEVAKL